jgi:GT2 family glycosyltransferase
MWPLREMEFEADRLRDVVQKSLCSGPRTMTIVMASFNRREVTLACLRSLRNQEITGYDLSISVFLLDDKSSDGTVEAVAVEFPAVRIIRGTGRLFWCRSMRIAFASAAACRPDYVLWMNDDTLLHPMAVERMLRISEALVRPGIVVGGAVDPESGLPTYGGLKRQCQLSFSFSLVRPHPEKPLSCDTMNGNCVLIPRSIYEQVGNLDPRFIHSMGDIDYGLRSIRAGHAIWVCPGAIGTCPRNEKASSWQDASLTFGQRMRRAAQPKGLPPKQWMHLTFRHGGVLAPVHFLSPYAKIALQSLNRIRFT